MTYSISNPQKIGNHVVAIISRHEVSARQCRVGRGYVCSKKPLVVLSALGNKVTAQDLGGTEVDHRVVEALCPGALRTMLALGSSSG